MNCLTLQLLVPYDDCMEKRDKTVTIRLPDTMLKEMRELANEHTRSLNEEVLVALPCYIKQQQQGLKPRRLTAQAEAVAACGGLKPFFCQD